MMEVLSKLMRLMQNSFFKFSITGIFSNILNFSVYIFFVSFFSNTLAAGIGYLAGLICSFILGKYWVFRSVNTKNFPQILRFFIVYAIGGFGMVSIVYVLEGFTNTHYIINWMSGAIFAIFNNYFGSKFIVFGKLK